MPKKLDVSYDIPADVETVYAVISGEGWAAAKAERFEDESRQESRTVGAGDAVTLVVSRGLPDGIPGFLEKFLPRGGRARQSEAWGAADGGARRGTWQGEIPGAPATVGGTMALEPTATGTLYRIQGEVKVSIPLVGGKAESFIVDMIGKLTKSEAELLASLV
ncbi:MAG TPA: DUF2505 domain-containing protein [Mycobacteriales bacterium]|nr:DUF2505 domain-containing protein [Mycobacteriales bacterium]